MFTRMHSTNFSFCFPDLFNSTEHFLHFPEFLKKDAKYLNAIGLLILILSSIFIICMSILYNDYIKKKEIMH
jgi:hypothetical protein